MWLSSIRRLSNAVLKITGQEEASVNQEPMYMLPFFDFSWYTAIVLLLLKHRTWKRSVGPQGFQA